MIFDSLWQLERLQKEMTRGTQARIKKGIQNKVPQEQLNNLYDVTTNYVAFYEEIRQRALSDRLQRQAQRLNLPVPPESEWHKGTTIPYMTPAMQTELRKDI